jgi:uncharacterized protein YrzB (UPF0473 family)
MKNETNEIKENQDGDQIIVITDEKGKKHDFEIVLNVPFEEKEYLILHPLDDFPGLDEDSCAIFELLPGEGDEATLIPETDDDILDSIYAIYVEWATEQERRESMGCQGSCEGCSGCSGLPQEE